MSRGSLPTSVYVVIHDKEPYDSGSDYRYSAMLPARQDTDIIGIYYNYRRAAGTARDYILDMFGVDVEDDNEQSGDDSTGFDWEGEGSVRVPIGFILRSILWSEIRS